MTSRYHWRAPRIGRQCSILPIVLHSSVSHKQFLSHISYFPELATRRSIGTRVTITIVIYANLRVRAGLLSSPGDLAFHLSRVASHTPTSRYVRAPSRGTPAILHSFREYVTRIQ